MNSKVMKGHVGSPDCLCSGQLEKNNQNVTTGVNRLKNQSAVCVCVCVCVRVCVCVSAGYFYVFLSDTALTSACSE